jgi:hypothetical protein
MTGNLQFANGKVDVSNLLDIAPLSLSAAYNGYVEISGLVGHPITQTTTGTVFAESSKAWESFIGQNKIEIKTDASGELYVFLMKDSASAQSKLIEETIRLDQVSVHKALDYIYDRIDSMMMRREFSKISEELKQVKPERFNIETLLGFLTITLVAKDKIQSRSSLFSSVKSYLTRINDEQFAADVLQGLE